MGKDLLRSDRSGHVLSHFGSVQRSWSSTSDWISALRVPMGGAEKLTSPLEENEWVYAAVAAKCSAVSSAPIVVYASDDETEDDPIDKEHPVAKLFAMPNRFQSWASFAQYGCKSRCMTGEDWWLLLDETGNPVTPNGKDGLIDLPTNIVNCGSGAVDVDLDYKTGLPRAYRVTFAIGDVLFPPNAVLAIFDMPSPSKRFRGIGPIDGLRRKLEAQFQADRYLEGIARNGGQPAAWILLNDGIGNEAVQQFQKIINDETASPNNANGHKVLSGAREIIPNNVSPKDMEFDKLYRWVREAIGGCIGVPLQLIGSQESSTFANQEQALRQMWTGPNGVLSYQMRIEDVLNNQFFPRLRDPRMREMRAYFDNTNVKALQDDLMPVIEAASRTSRLIQVPVNNVLAASGSDAMIEGGDAVPMDLGAPIEGESDAGASADEVSQSGQKQLLNGAQMATAVDIVAQVTAGTLPRDSGLQMLVLLVGLNPADAERMMASAGTETPTTPNPNPSAANEPSAENGNDFAEPQNYAADGPSEAESKSMEPAPSRAPIVDRAARLERWRSIEEKRAKGDSLLKATAAKLIRAYELATLKRIEAFAESGARAYGARNVVKAYGRSTREPLAIEAGAFGVWKEIDIDSHLLDVLTVNKDEWESKFLKAFEGPLESVARDALKEAAFETGGVSIGVQNPAVTEQLIRRATKLAEGATSTLARDVKRAIADVFSGESSIADLQLAVRDKLPEITENVRGVFTGRDARALRIARTESAGASEGARYEQFKSDGVTELQWITQGDDIVRESHAAIDGDVVAIGSSFANGLKHAHDPDAPAEEVVNCRCSTLPAG